MPLASKLPAEEQATQSQILSLSLSSHLGNGNLYLQTVGAGGEHEILKSTSLCFPPPFLHGLSPLSLPTPPLTLFISEMHCKAARQLGVLLRSLVCNKSNILLVSNCRAPCHSSHSSSSEESSSVHCLHSSP